MMKEESVLQLDLLFKEHDDELLQSDLKNEDFIASSANEELT